MNKKNGRETEEEQFYDRVRAAHDAGGDEAFLVEIARWQLEQHIDMAKENCVTFEGWTRFLEIYRLGLDQLIETNSALYYDLMSGDEGGQSEKQ